MIYPSISSRHVKPCSPTAPYGPCCVAQTVRTMLRSPNRSGFPPSPPPPAATATLALARARARARTSCLGRQGRRAHAGQGFYEAHQTGGNHASRAATTASNVPTQSKQGGRVILLIEFAQPKIPPRCLPYAARAAIYMALTGARTRSSQTKPVHTTLSAS